MDRKTYLRLEDEIHKLWVKNIDSQYKLYPKTNRTSIKLLGYENALKDFTKIIDKLLEGKK